MRCQCCRETCITSHYPPKRHDSPLCYWIHGRANAENGGASALPRIPFCYVPSSSQCVTPARDRHWQGQGTQDSQLPLNFMVFTEMFFQVGWNLANVSLLTTFTNSDQHLKILLYTVLFLGMVSTRSLEYGWAETILNIYLSFGVKEKVLRAPDLCFRE